MTRERKIDLVQSLAAINILAIALTAIVYLISGTIGSKLTLYAAIAESVLIAVLVACAIVLNYLRK